MKNEGKRKKWKFFFLRNWRENSKGEIEKGSEQSVWVCECVCIPNVMCDYKSSDERGIRYVQRPLFSIIWHYPPIFFSYTQFMQGIKNFALLNSLSSVANAVDSDLKIRNLTYSPFFPVVFVSLLDLENANLRFQMRQIWRWVMSSAPGCGGTCAIKNEKRKSRRHFNKGKFQLVIRISHHFVGINLRSDDSALISMILI